MKIKKVFGILLTTIVVAFSGLFLSACDNSNSKTDSQKQVPVYQGIKSVGINICICIKQKWW